MAVIPTDPSEARRYPSIRLPDSPPGLSGAVKVWREPIEILTFSPEAADVNPMFSDRRVYQGSSGRVYPLPFCDRIASTAEPRVWDAVHLENEYLRVVVLPEIGGRIHVGLDKRNGYDFFYRQNVIRPALVGLAGPWISGGVEFNWPQHHRPATFMRVDTEIEQHPDGSATIWCSDHDPMLRMKGMHGIMLQPGYARIDLKVRLYNRTPYTQTFLWWANVAARVHERYQSFFPPDVRYVADHAKRAITSFPLSDRAYYGVDYPGRAAGGVPEEEQPAAFQPDGSYPANDLSWYANIPVPTSYMVVDTEDDFFGGYDHAREAGFVHIANHHIAPGKKQWTWGNHEFGYAWDRNLTLEDGPYIELMAGVYTDNQPDFSFLAPWETRTFSQSWMPIFGTGVPQAANCEVALRLDEDQDGAGIRLQSCHDIEEVVVVLRAGTKEVRRWDCRLSPGETLTLHADFDVAKEPGRLAVEVTAGGQLLIAYRPEEIAAASVPVPAREPAAPADVAAVEELYLTGLHLLQNRHATRDPEPYWREALRRDPEHTEANNALGLGYLRRGEFDEAAQAFERAITRLTRLNPNPRNGEPFYNMGLAERFRSRAKAAYDAFYKATWNAAWRAPAFFALAELDCKQGEWRHALNHLNLCLRAEADHLNARNLRVAVLRRLGRDDEADREHTAIRQLDPLDIHSRWDAGIQPSTGQEVLDLAYDLLRSGQDAEAHRLLRAADMAARDGSVPMILLTLAQVQDRLGEDGSGTRGLAETVPLDYCFPSRLEELIVLQETVLVDPSHGAAQYLLGNLLYDAHRYEEATSAWETATKLRPSFPTAWRNLGIARFNARKDVQGALAAFDRAVAADPCSARLLYERDQLWKRAGRDPVTRLAELQRHADLVGQRDDLIVELATLRNQTGGPEEALRLLNERGFQPWEGGEGLALEQYVRSRILLARRALSSGNAKAALAELEQARQPPHNLSEARHLLANQSELTYWLGVAYAALGDAGEARRWWLRTVRQQGDFEQMAVRTISRKSYWIGMALLRLDRVAEADEAFHGILAYARELEAAEPRIDYFATSLPNLLLFTEDLPLRNRLDALLLRSQALYGLGRSVEAQGWLQEILALDPNHTDAADLLVQIGDAQGIGE